MEALIHALLLEDHQQPPRKRAKKVAPLTKASPLTAMCNLMMTSKQLRDLVRQQIGPLFQAAARFNTQGCPVLAIEPIRADVIVKLKPGSWNKHWTPYPKTLVNNIIVRATNLDRHCFDSLQYHYKKRIQTETHLQVLGTDANFSEAEILSTKEKTTIVAYFVKWVLLLQAEECTCCTKPFTDTSPKCTDSFQMGMALCSDCYWTQWTSSKELFAKNGLLPDHFIGKVLMRNAFGEVHLWRPHLVRYPRTLSTGRFYKRVVSFLSAQLKARHVRTLRASSADDQAFVDAVQTPSEAIPPPKTKIPQHQIIRRTKPLPPPIQENYMGRTLQATTALGEIVNVRCPVVTDQNTDLFQNHLRAYLQPVLHRFQGGCILSEFNRPLYLLNVAAA